MAVGSELELYDYCVYVRTTLFNLRDPDRLKIYDLIRRNFYNYICSSCRLSSWPSVYFCTFIYIFL